VPVEAEAALALVRGAAAGEVATRDRGAAGNRLPRTQPADVQLLQEYRLNA